MIIDTHLSLYGEKFSPSLLGLRTGLTLTDTKEVDEFGSANRSRSTPMPYGSATLRLHAPTDEYEPQTEDLVLAMETHAEEIRQCGAEDLVFWIVAYAEHDEQRNLELSPIIMGKLSSMGVTVAISIYDKDLLPVG